jgi:hypothetical protein
VRGDGKTSGAIRFACLFLCFFLLGKQKKEGKEVVSRQKWNTLLFDSGSPYLMRERRHLCTTRQWSPSRLDN